LGGAPVGQTAATAASTAASALPVFQRLVLGSTALTDPVRAMMDALASTALNLLRGNQPPTSIATPAPAPNARHRDSNSV